MDNYTFRLMDTIEVSFEGSVQAQVEVPPAAESSNCGCEHDPGDGAGCAPSDCESGSCGSNCAPALGPRLVTVYAIAGSELVSRRLTGGDSPTTLSAAYAVVEAPVGEQDDSQLAFRAYKDDSELASWVATLPGELRAQLQAN